MKKKETISTMLALKQEEMAALLEISRGLWSMYEAGKRDLPQHAQLKLAEILSYMDSAKATMSKNKADKRMERIELKTLLKENEHQQVKTARELATAERKLESGLKAMQLAGYLNSQSHSKAQVHGWSKLIEIRAHKVIKKNGIPVLTKLKIKQQTLQYEETLLKTALGK